MLYFTRCLLIFIKNLNEEQEDSVQNTKNLEKEFLIS